MPRWGKERKPHTFVEYTKGFIDLLNAWFWRKKGFPVGVKNLQSVGREDGWGCIPSDSKVLDFCKKVNSITYYENVVVLEFNSEIKVEYGEILNNPEQGRKSRHYSPSIIHGPGRKDGW
jgi:hypothetical protein